MKAVPKVDLDGYFIEDVIVDDSFSGVVPIYFFEESVNDEIAGYTIGYSVPVGLYKPRFDLAVWNDYQEAVCAAQDEYQAVYAKWSTLPAEERGEAPVYVRPKEPEFWVEGLTPKEIAELTVTPQQEPSETEQLKQRIADLEVALAKLMAGK